MGDPARNERFAKFIFQHFSPKKYKRVLVIADGKGELAVLLSKKYIVQVIENKPRQVTKRKRVHYTHGWFDTMYEVKEDFIVGMHPDEATAEIVLSGEKYNKRWAIVPCCLKGIQAHGVNKFSGWLEKLTSFSDRRKVNTAWLKIGGKNTVLWT